MPGQRPGKQGERCTRPRRLRPQSAQARGEAPPPRAPATVRPAHRKPPPSGTARSFRPEAWRWPFGSGSSPTLAREPSRSLNIREQRLAPACISGDVPEGKDPVTPLPVSRAARAPALGAAAPSGAVSPAPVEGARAWFLEPSRETGRFLTSRPQAGRVRSPRPAELPGRLVPGAGRGGAKVGLRLCVHETEFRLVLTEDCIVFPTNNGKAPFAPPCVGPSGEEAVRSLVLSLGEK